ncbi:MAG: hypothetical protein ABSH53_20935 [Holophaga sp.]|jgi:hypothetical protein
MRDDPLEYLPLCLGFLRREGHPLAHRLVHGLLLQLLLWLCGIEESLYLNRRLGELMMENELLREKAEGGL